MKSLISFIRRDHGQEATIVAVTEREATLSNIAKAKEARSRSYSSTLFPVSRGLPVTGLTTVSLSDQKLHTQHLVDRSRNVRRVHNEETLSSSSLNDKQSDPSTQEDKIIRSARLEALPACLICSRNGMFVPDRPWNNRKSMSTQVFWNIRHIRIHRDRCSSCRLIATMMGDLLYSLHEKTIVCGRVEHFATHCQTLSEATRLWLFFTSVEQGKNMSMSSLAPKSYTEQDQPLLNTSLGCVQTLSKRSWGNNGHDLFSGRYVNPEVTDFSLISRWLSLCESGHQAKCGRDDGVHDTLARTVRVVDVIKGCIVVAPLNCRYLALSYVWGDFNQLQLNSATLDYLSTEGALFETRLERGEFSGQLWEAIEIPRTIKDAIKLCQKLGEQYLWVDSLSILQDDTNDKHVQISHMDAVYREAVLTIVAAAGTDCNHGLPGVRQRQPISHVSNVSEGEYNNVLIATDRDVIQTMLSSKWNKRAWTLQEKILSQRLLVFTPCLVFFYCQTALWREDCALEDEHADIYLNERETLDSQILGRSAASYGPIKAFTDAYSRLVTAFVVRELSREDDALNAFSGICKSLEPALGPFRWGLPSRVFGVSLLWRTSVLAPGDTYSADDHKYNSSYVRSSPMESRSHRRSSSAKGHYEGGQYFLRPNDAIVPEGSFRTSSPTSESDASFPPPSIRPFWAMRSGFPSWSWAGWKHWSESQIVFDQPLDIRSLLSFFEVSFAVLSQIQTPSGPSGWRLSTNQTSQAFVDLHLVVRCGIDVYRVSEELQEHIKSPDKPQPFALPPMLHFAKDRSRPLYTSTPESLLVFWTSTSEAKIRVREDPRRLSPAKLTISTSSGYRMADFPTNGAITDRLQGLLEFVLVAITLDGELALMLIQWGDDGVAYRVPILDLEFRITQEDWLATKPYKKRIVLG